MKNVKKELVAYLFSAMLLLIMASCKKIEPDSPPVTIQSVRALSLTAYEVVVRLEYVDLYKIKSGKLVFDDITVLTDSNIEKEFTAGRGSDQTDTIIVETGRVTHDYYITASAETNKGLCISEPFLMRSQKYNFNVNVVPDTFYSSLTDNIADFVNIGSSFDIRITSLSLFHASEMEVKLNRTISLGKYTEYAYVSDFDNQSGTIDAHIFAFVPFDFQPGIYDVYFYIDGIEYKCQSRIKVLAGKWTIIEPGFQGDNRGRYAWFLKGDNLYLIGGENYLTEVTESPVWKYNIPQNHWERKNNFPHPGDFAKNKIMPLNLEYNGEGYIVLKNNISVEVWRYNADADLWYFVTNYPGQSYENLAGFILDGKLYLGGGNSNVLSQDFWAFDLGSSVWDRRSDIPMSSWGYISVVVSSGKAYVYPYSGELWQYDPESNKWTMKSRFPGHERIFSGMTVRNDKIYITGGYYFNTSLYPLNDCWKYSETDDTWEMVAYLPNPFSNNVSFTWQGSVFAGLSWMVNQGSAISDNLIFYKLDI